MKILKSMRDFFAAHARYLRGDYASQPAEPPRPAKPKRFVGRLYADAGLFFYPDNGLDAVPIYGVHATKPHIPPGELRITFGADLIGSPTLTVVIRNKPKHRAKPSSK